MLIIIESMPEFTVSPGDIMVKFIAPEDGFGRGPDKVTDAEKKN